MTEISCFRQGAEGVTAAGMSLPGPPASLSVPATACFYIGLYGLLQVALWVRIMMVRAPQPEATHNLENLRASKDKENLRVTRAHGNYTENAPMFAVMLLCADALGSARWLVELTGFAFCFARLMHARGMEESSGATVGRMVGAGLTLLSLTLAASQCIYVSLAFMAPWVYWSRVVALGAAAALVSVLAPVKVGA